MTNTIGILNEADDGGEDADILVCARLTSPQMMPDNEINLCSNCGEAIQHRPRVPKSPRKMCLPCVAPLAAKAAAKGELHSFITAADLAVYLRRKNAN